MNELFYGVRMVVRIVNVRVRSRLRPRLQNNRGVRVSSSTGNRTLVACVELFLSSSSSNLMVICCFGLSSLGNRCSPLRFNSAKKIKKNTQKPLWKKRVTLPAPPLQHQYKGLGIENALLLRFLSFPFIHL